MTPRKLTAKSRSPLPPALWLPAEVYSAEVLDPSGVMKHQEKDNRKVELRKGEGVKGGTGSGTGLGVGHSLPNPNSFIRPGSFTQSCFEEFSCHRSGTASFGRLEHHKGNILLSFQIPFQIGFSPQWVLPYKKEKKFQVVPFAIHKDSHYKESQK